MYHNKVKYNLNKMTWERFEQLMFMNKMLFLTSSFISQSVFIFLRPHVGKLKY